MTVFEKAARVGDATERSMGAASVPSGQLDTRFRKMSATCLRDSAAGRDALTTRVNRPTGSTARTSAVSRSVRQHGIRIESCRLVMESANALAPQGTGAHSKMIFNDHSKGGFE